MSKGRRVLTVVVALLGILGAVILMSIPEYAYEVLELGISLTLVYYGVRYIIYYITNAQHMVGGKWFLLIGIIMFDMGVFATAIYDRTQKITLIYIICAQLVAAMLSLIRAAGDMKDKNPSWKFHLAQGIGSSIQVILCLIFINSAMIPLYLYCIYAIYTAILMIISAFKKTAIVYVQ